MLSRTRFRPRLRGLLVVLLLACAGGLAGAGAGMVVQGTSAGRLVDQHGRAFAIEALGGRTVVLSFVFTHCGSTCPIQTQALRRVRESLPDELAERVAFVSLSLDPERDSPEALRGFARAHGIEGPGWWLVTGDPARLAALAARYRIAAARRGDGEIEHRDTVFLIDASGRVAQRYAGPAPDGARLVREIASVDRLRGRDTAAVQARLEETQ